MVYWHVEKNAACIYSQLRRVSSSQAAAMIKGVLRHCTEMEVDRQYVDSHGQSAVAFAFCRLLGFELIPRLKGISRQKHCKALAGQSFSNLDPVMALRAINWELIEEQLDTMVKTCSGAKAENDRCGEPPAPLYAEKRPTSSLKSSDRTRQGHQDDFPLPLSGITQHINPYGRFELDMETWLLIEDALYV